MSDIFDYHKKQTILLSNSVNKKTKIYLDTKYWVDICDVTLGKKENDNINKIYEFLKKGVSENKLICPISYHIYIEIIKQDDPQTLTQSAKIIDELSQGIIIKINDKVLELELFNFLYNRLNIKVDLGASQNYWDYIYNIHGFMAPDMEFSIQKKYFDDVVKKYKLSDMIKVESFKETLYIYRNNKINTDWFNAKKEEHSKEHKTIHHLYMAELGGILDIYQKHIKFIFQEVIEHKAKIENTILPPADDDTIGMKIIYNSFDHKKMNMYLPSIDIYAMLSAKSRWNKTQKYKQGDFIDIGHATTALPYYDYFFTEKSLHNMIRECKYDEKYNCQVASRDVDVLSLLELN